MTAYTRENGNVILIRKSRSVLQLRCFFVTFSMPKGCVRARSFLTQLDFCFRNRRK